MENQPWCFKVQKVLEYINRRKKSCCFVPVAPAAAAGLRHPSQPCVCYTTSRGISTLPHRLAIVWRRASAGLSGYCLGSSMLVLHVDAFRESCSSATPRRPKATATPVPRRSRLQQKKCASRSERVSLSGNSLTPGLSIFSSCRLLQVCLLRRASEARPMCYGTIVRPSLWPPLVLLGSHAPWPRREGGAAEEEGH